MRLDGKVAIVTGGGRGIGKTECEQLAQAGAAVVVNDFGGGADGSGTAEGPANEVADAIVAAGGKAVPHYGDVSKMETGTDLVQTALREFGRVDILVNNAGILRDRMLHKMTEAEWDAVIAVHLKGTFVCTRAVAEVFREQRSGVIVNTSSESGLGNMGQSNYAAAKEGIAGFTRTVALDLGRYGVRANAIRPRAATRMTLSDQLRDAVERAKKAGEPHVDLDRLESWTPDVVGAFVAWLCTDAAKDLTGQDFLVSSEGIALMTQPRPTGNVPLEGGFGLDEFDKKFAGAWKPIAPYHGG
jgi:NAD(P)-dependent dehydrogenase (short-subunit alcohol dehydrogenase family)